MAEIRRVPSKKSVVEGRLRDADFELKEKLGEGFAFGFQLIVFFLISEIARMGQSGGE